MATKANNVQVFLANGTAATERRCTKDLLKDYIVANYSCIQESDILSGASKADLVLLATDVANNAVDRTKEYAALKKGAAVCQAASKKAGSPTVAACGATTKAGTPCTLARLPGKDLCHIHVKLAGPKCEAVTKAGTPCQLAAQEKSKFCEKHSDIQCEGLKADGQRCKNKGARFCRYHQKQDPPKPPTPSPVSSPPTASQMPPPPSAPKAICTAVTHKGTRCTRAAAEGSECCYQHKPAA
jgi:hypothetical protein